MRGGFDQKTISGKLARLYRLKLAKFAILTSVQASCCLLFQML